MNGNMQNLDCLSTKYLMPLIQRVNTVSNMQAQIFVSAVETVS